MSDNPNERLREINERVAAGKATTDDMQQLPGLTLSLAWDNIGKVRQQQRQQSTTAPTPGVSDQVAHLVKQASQLNSGVCLGDCVNQMEKEHKQLGTETPFDWDAAKNLLLQQFPHLDMNHRDNPMRQQARLDAERMMRQRDALLNGATTADYRLSMGSSTL